MHRMLNATLYSLAFHYLPHFYFDSTESFYPIEMCDFLMSNKNVYYKNNRINNNITDYSKLLDLVVDDREKLVYSSSIHTPTETFYSIRGNIRYYDFINTENPIYVEFFEKDDHLYVIYDLLYMFNGDILCGFVIPCGFHDGDIEHVILDFHMSTLIPERIFYSSHHDGYWFPWNEVEKEETHPVVYVAKSSHANYPIRGYFMRYFGFINEFTDGAVKWTPQKLIPLHYNFSWRSPEYLYNGYVGEVPSFYSKKDKYIKQIEEEKVYSYREMLSDMFYALSAVKQFIEDIYV